MASNITRTEVTFSKEGFVKNIRLFGDGKCPVGSDKTAYFDGNGDKKLDEFFGPCGAFDSQAINEQNVAFNRILSDVEKIIAEVSDEFHKNTDVCESPVNGMVRCKIGNSQLLMGDLDDDGLPDIAGIEVNRLEKYGDLKLLQVPISMIDGADKLYARGLAQGDSAKVTDTTNVVGPDTTVKETVEKKDVPWPKLPYELHPKKD